MRRVDRFCLAAGLVFLGFAGPARAALGDACTADADCSAGMVCSERVYTACGGSAGAGGEGGRVEDVDCHDVIERFCAPMPCDVAARCPGGTSCVSFTSVSCVESGYPDTGVDAAGGKLEPECTEITESWCVPSYLAPCVVDADCGPGFTCVGEEICGTPDTGAGGEDCESSEAKHCELVITPCSVSSDCGAGLECQAFEDWICEGSVDPDDPPPATGGGSASDSAGSDEGVGGMGGSAEGDRGGGMGGATGAEDCQVESTSLCAPPGFIDWMGAYADSGDSAGGLGGEGGLGGTSNEKGGGLAAEDDDGASSASVADDGLLSCQTGGSGLSALAFLAVALILRRR